MNLSGSKYNKIYQKSKEITISFIDELHKKEHLKMYVTIEDDIHCKKFAVTAGYIVSSSPMGPVRCSLSFHTLHC